VFFNINRTNLWQMIAVELVLLALWRATISWFGPRNTNQRLLDERIGLSARIKNGSHQEPTFSGLPEDLKQINRTCLPSSIYSLI
jgi:hypothetical protein